MRERRAWGQEGRIVGNAELIGKIRRLQARLDDLEVRRQRDTKGWDVSELEEEVKEGGGAPDKETPKVKLLRSLLGSSSRRKPELSTYNGNLVAKKLFEWISELDKYFEYEDMDDDKQVNFTITRLKGHVVLWWDNV